MSDDIHALSGAYAIDALDAHERDAFERHLTNCAACQAEVDSLREAANLVADSVSLTPPAHLREQILGNIAQVRPLPPVIQLAPKPTSRRAWFSGALLAAAAIALFLMWVQPGASKAPAVVSASQIVQARDVVQVGQRLDNGARVTWYHSADLNGSAVAIQDLPMPAPGKTYELWLQTADGTMHRAGLIGGGDQLVKLTSQSAVSAVGAGLTIEPAGGSDKPTLPPVTVATFPTT